MLTMKQARKMHRAKYSHVEVDTMLESPDGPVKVLGSQRVNLGPPLRVWLRSLKQPMTGKAQNVLQSTGAASNA